MYERQDGIGLEIGSYAHRSILHDPEEIPSIEDAALSPTEFPFTQDDFDPQMEDALDADARDRRRRVGRREVRDQRPHLAHAGRHAAPRRDARGQGPLVGRRRVGQGGAGGRQVHRRVDGPRRARDRPAPSPTSAASTTTRRRASARQGARVRGVPQDVRDRPPGRAVVVRPRPAHVADARARARSSAPSSSRSPAGSGRSGTRRTRRSSSATASSRARHEWDARWWSPIINAEHLAMRERAGIFDLSAFAIFDVDRARARSTRSRAAVLARWTCRSAASSTRRCSRRAAASSPTSRSCGSGRRLPRRHRRRPRDGRPQVVQRPCLRRHARARRPHDGLDDDRRSGARARATSSRASTTDDVSHEGVPVRDVPDDRDRLAARAGVADLVRRRPRLGAVRADRAGRAALGRALGGRPGRTG